MSEFQVRGYVIASAAAYLRSTAGEQEAKRVFGELSPQLQQVIESGQSATWYPGAQIAELYRCIATTLGGGNEDRAREALINCGKFTAHEATNTYLRLLMRMLSLSLFAKKMPDFWKRDNSRGKLVVELKEQTLTCRLYEIDGYDHAAAVAAGFAVFAFEAMGKSIESVKLYDWSLVEPCKEGSRLEIKWKK